MLKCTKTLYGNVAIKYFPGVEGGGERRAGSGGGGGEGEEGRGKRGGET